MAIADFFW